MPEEIEHCYRCDSELEGNDVVTCSCCEAEGCERCLDTRECTMCDNIVCDGCVYYDDDNDPLCPNCYRERKLSLDYASNTIHNYSAKFDWKFEKQPWENTLYLGVELECNFRHSNVENMYEISNKYLPGKHAWKEDGSLESGAELVITPHTLQAYRKVGIKDMLKDFSKYATSYDSGECGLHVHVNRDALGPTNSEGRVPQKIRRFFGAARTHIRKFSMRNDYEYCIYPMHWRERGWNQRQCAVNFRNDATIEFRVFRGTLDYRRFLASLQFVDCVCNFCKEHSLAVFRGNCPLDAFRAYMESHKQYTHLEEYLREKAIFY